MWFLSMFLFLAPMSLIHSSPAVPYDKISSEVMHPQLVNVAFPVEESEGASCHPSHMTLFKFSKRRRAKCNDYSPAGYYLRESVSSTKWVIYLPGGWYCSDEMSCANRAFEDPDLLSSNNWKQCINRWGIMSSRRENNPYFYDANTVYVPYCSSDMWTGRAMKHRFGNESFSFMGSVIIEEVFRHLIAHRGMRDATSILLAGSSAGGTGVFMNIDRLQVLLNNLGVNVQIRGVADSAWYLMRPEMDEEVQCTGFYCPQVALLAKGVNVWQAQIPTRCRQSYARNGGEHAHATPTDESWKCFFGHVIYPYVKAPIFIAQWMFDRFQLQEDYGQIFSRRNEAGFYLGYFRNLSIDIRTQLEQVDAVFSPSCIDHAILERKDWTSVYVSGVNLPTAINCWQRSLDEKAATNNNKTVNDDAIDGTEQEQTPLFSGLFQNIDSDEFSSDSPLYRGEYPEEIEESLKCVYKAIDTYCIPQKNRSCQQLFGYTNQFYIDILDYLNNDVDSLERSSGFATRSKFFKAFCGR